MGICENVQSLCKKNNLPVSHLEKELALANGSIRRWNESSPSVDKLQKVASHFNVSTDYLLYGFDRVQLAHLVNTIKNGRSVEQFSEDTGISIDELIAIGTATKYERPSLETVKKITTANPVDFLVDYQSLLKAAGYIEITNIDEGTFTTPNTPFKPVAQEELSIPSGIYLRLAKEAEEMQLTENDLQLISEMFKRFKKAND